MGSRLWGHSLASPRRRTWTFLRWVSPKFRRSQLGLPQEPDAYGCGAETSWKLERALTVDAELGGRTQDHLPLPEVGLAVRCQLGQAMKERLIRRPGRLADPCRKERISEEKLPT